MSQATLPERPYVNANLFSGHYLDERVPDREEWDCDGAAREAMESLRALYDEERGLLAGYGEDEMFDDWIAEVLDVLGFGTHVEATLPDGGGYVDALLFADEAARREAGAVYRRTGDATDLFERGVGLLEAKQWDADFDARLQGRAYRDASHQVKHYLERTPRDVRWGVLTNGRKWRLYGTKDYETRTYYEVDLPELLERGDLTAFKYFFAFFRPAAFRRTAGTTFLDELWAESETAARRLGEDLQDEVFTALRVLGRGFMETNDLDIDPDDEAALDELKEQSLVLLYRLMFVLYAEARGLVHPEGPAAEAEYEVNFGLDALRLAIHEEVGEVDVGFDDAYSEHSTAMWSRLDDLFRLVDEGEESLGIPPYDGGLFDREAHAFLTDHAVSDRHLAEVIYRLSTTRTDGGRFVLADYADLDTRHLGSVYEGLLEHEFRIAPEDYAAVAKDGGQVWTPADDATGAEIVETVTGGGLYLVNDRGERKATGAYYTPDFVVTYVVEETLGPLVEEIRVDLLEQGFEPGTQAYLGPFLRRVRDLTVLDPAMGSGHFLTRATGYLAEQVMSEVREVEAELGVAFDEQHVRREIARECIYGVDVNGMAVELAKLSMWLETLAADRPLAFLDHHLKVGNSLLGSDVEAIRGVESDATDDEQASLAAFGATRAGTVERLMERYADLLAIENETVDDVREMKATYAEIERDEVRRRLVAMADVHAAEQFGLDVPDGAHERMARALADDDEWVDVERREWFRSARAMAAEEDFFHWKLAFPEVFYEADGSPKAEPGFDAVVGNPPYVNVERIPDGHLDYYRATTDTARRRVNLYVLFSERSMDLLRPGGVHGFVVPDKILSETYATAWRRLVLSEHALRSVYDLRGVNVFPDAAVDPIVFTLRTDREADRATVHEPAGGTPAAANEIVPADFLDFEECRIRLDWTPETARVVDAVRDGRLPASRILYASWGAQPGNADRFFRYGERPDDDSARRLIKGGNVDRYAIDWEDSYVLYRPDELHRPAFPALFESEKLVFKDIAGERGLLGCLDADGFYTDHTLVNCVSKAALRDADEETLRRRGIVFADRRRSEVADADATYDRDAVIYREDAERARRYSLRTVLAVCNSKLLGFYYARYVSGNLHVFPQHVRNLPLPDVEFTDEPVEVDLAGRYDEWLQEGDDPAAFVDGLRDGDDRDDCDDRGDGDDTDGSDRRGESDEVLHDALDVVAGEMLAMHAERRDLNLDLLDYLRPYADGPALADVGRYRPPAGVADTALSRTAEDHENLRIGQVTCEREGPGTVTVSATARYKPDDEERTSPPGGGSRPPWTDGAPDSVPETDRWGYAETEPLAAMRLSDLSEREADLVEAFVPVAVEEAGGFANFRETATTTTSPVERLEALVLPDPDDVADGLARYRDAAERAAALDERIERTDDLIDRMVYDLYGLDEEAVAIVEGSVVDDGG